MRLLLVASIAALAACGAEPRPSADVMPELAAEYGASVNAGDQGRMLRYYAPGPKTERVSGHHARWLHGRLGACGAPRLMWTGSEGDARFTYPCEHGSLEAHFILDEHGQIVRLRSGAHGIRTPRLLRDAVLALTASLPWDPGTKQPFTNNLGTDASRKLGTCEVLRPWVVGSHGGLFHLRCEHGDTAVLRVLLHRHGTLARVDLLPGNVYKGPPVVPLKRRKAAK
jgi:hypothetical protein